MRVNELLGNFSKKTGRRVEQWDRKVKKAKQEYHIKKKSCSELFDGLIIS